MKTRISVIVLVFVILVSSTAFAEDGFKVLLGFSLAQDNYKITGYLPDGSSNTSTKNEGSTVYRPSVDMQYEKGPLFLRALYDYGLIPNSQSEYSGGGGSPIKGHFWDAEGDLGYKVYDKHNVSLTPYVGFGNRFFKTINKLNHSSWGKVNTPYAALGNIATYTADRWSVGLDTALFMLFAGKFKEPFTSFTYATHFNFGLGCRIQIPVTYSIRPKKDHSVGVVVFLTPYYEFYNTGKSDAEPFPITLEKVRMSNRVCGAKVGIGFEF